MRDSFVVLEGCRSASVAAVLLCVRLTATVPRDWGQLGSAPTAREGHELGMCFQITVSLKRAGVNQKFSETPDRCSVCFVPFDNISCQGIWEDTSSSDNIDLASLALSFPAALACATLKP